MKSKQLEITKNVFVSRDGREFDIGSDSWRLNKNDYVRLYWVSRLDKDFATTYRTVLARCTEEYSGSTVVRFNSDMRRYFNASGDKIFQVDSLISYRSRMSNSEEHYLGNLRSFIRAWCAWGYDGIPECITELMDGWRLKGVEKGKAVKSLDPREGPLTEIEMSGLVEAMVHAYVSGRLSLTDYVVTAILVYTGRRPIQITSLKIKDIRSRKSGTAIEYSLNFPRAKQRFSHWRSSFTEFSITEDLWRVVTLHASKVPEQIVSVTGFTLDESAIGELPLFPDLSAIESYSDKKLFMEVCSTDEFHIKLSFCNDVLKKLGNMLNVYSERTGEKIDLTTRRFRYTLGSNIGREGKGELIIAEALDHSDTQNVGVYVKNLPDVVERIDRAVAFQLAPLAQAFQGVLVDSELNARRGEDPSSRIGNGEVAVGTCGSYGFCSALAPIACYTCKHFQPWVDGPHEIIMDELIEKKDEVLRDTNDIKIASSNDRLILAVAQVIRRCHVERSRRGQLEMNDV